MHHSEYLVDVLIFLIAAIIVVPLFQRLRSSPILGYLAAGVMIGPYGLQLIGDTKAAHTFAELGVVFLLFMIGLELSFSRLKILGGKVFGLGSLQVIITALIIGAIAWSAGFKLEVAFIIGGGLALSSTAFVMQLLTERGEKTTNFGLSTFSILLLQDLAIVPLLVFVTLIGSAHGSFLEAFAIAALKGGAGIVTVILFGRYLLKPLYKMIAHNRSTELFVSTTLLVILGMGWLISTAGLSMELGALLAGLLLAETEYRHQIEADIKPFKGILLGLFFMSIGMSIDINLIIEKFSLIALIVIALLAGKTIITAILCKMVGIANESAIRTGFALSQGGEFGFVLFGAALTLGILPKETSQLLIAVITLSMVATPMMFYIGKKLSLCLQGHAHNLQNTFDANIEEANNHVLIAGFGRVGQTVARILSDAGIPYTALDLKHSRVEKCRAKGMPVYFGDANQIHVLNAAGAQGARMAVITLDNEEKSSRTVSELRNSYPDLLIYVRAKDRRHMQHLEKNGATAVVSEAAESSLQLGSIALASLEVNPDGIASVIQEYRDNDYKKLEEIIT